VLGIHGVADQEPCETARAIADLLGVGATKMQRTSFVEEPLRLPLARLHKDAVIGQEGQDAGGRLMTRQLAQYDPRTPARQDAVGPDREEGRVHGTTCLRGVLPGSDGERPREVHVFEMHWGDLSRLGPSLLRGLVELYQLLFFLVSQGAATVKLAAEYSEGWLAPKILWVLVTVVERGLARCIPLLNLVMLGLLMLAVPLCFEAGTNRLLATALPGALALVFLTKAALARLPGKRIGVWLARWGGMAGLLILGLSGGVAWCAWACMSMVPAAVLLAAELSAAAVCVFLWIVKAYDRRQPGVLKAGWWCAGAWVAALVIEGGCRWEEWGAANGALDKSLLLLTQRLAEYDLVLMYLVWAPVLLAAALTLPVCAWVRAGWGKKCPGDSAHWKIRRAAWTGMLTAVSAPLVVIVLNLALWSALLLPVTPAPSMSPPGWEAMPNGSPVLFLQSSMTLPRRLMDTLNTAQVTTLGLRKEIVERIGLLGRSSDSEPEASEMPFMNGPVFVRRMLDEGGNVASLFVIMRAAAGVVLVGALLPAIFSEGCLPHATDEKTASVNLGISLSRGYKRMRLALLLLGGTLLWLCIIPRFPSIYDWSMRHGGDWLHERSRALVLSMGAGLVALVVFSRGPLEFLALGLRAGLDVALDVVNWLREHPKDDNVRSRITERYVSMLRHLCDERSGYAAVVIVAHSQGCMIAADVMRHLWRCRASLLVHGREPRLARWLEGRLPVHLFTMGCPLRQLYSLRFPHLYAWARADEPPEVERLKAGDVPRVKDIGVTSWTNAYRSGDYVGRCLWQDEQNDAAWTPGEAALVNDDPECQEFCIGSGGHTHYWDVTAPGIAHQFRLILEKA